MRKAVSTIGLATVRTGDSVVDKSHEPAGVRVIVFTVIWEVPLMNDPQCFCPESWVVFLILFVMMIIVKMPKITS